MKALLNTTNLYSVRAACPDCLAAGHPLAEHGHPETTALSTIETDYGPVEVDHGRRASGCFAAELEFWTAAKEGRLVSHTFDCPDRGDRWDIDSGRWNAVIRAEDHVTRLHGPGHVWDERLGIVAQDDSRI